MEEVPTTMPSEEVSSQKDDEIVADQTEGVCLEQVDLPVPDEILGHTGLYLLGHQKRQCPKEQEGRLTPKGMPTIHAWLQELLREKERSNQTGPLAGERLSVLSTRKKLSKLDEAHVASFVSRLDLHPPTNETQVTTRSFSARARLETSKPLTHRGAQHSSKKITNNVRKAQTRPSSGRVPPYGGPKWGATEGGRDTLGWVRQLVKYTETHPVFIPEARSSELSVDDGEGWRKTVFPSRHPDRREDVKLLEHWLRDMMEQLEVGTQNRAGQGSAEAPEIANAAIWVYGMAFSELKRQIGTECQERAELLASLWDQFVALIELQSAVAHEEEISEVIHLCEAAQKDNQSLGKDKKKVEDLLHEKEAERKSDRQRSEQENQNLAVKLAKAQRDARDQAQETTIVETTLKEEIQKRLDAESVLSRTQMLLSQTKDEQLAAKSRANLLEQQCGNLTKSITKLKNDVQEAQQELEKERAHSSSLLQKNTELELEYSRMRREYETNDIIILGLKEQLKVREKSSVELTMQVKESTSKLEAGIYEIQQLNAENRKLQDILSSVKHDKWTLEKALQSQMAEYNHYRTSMEEKMSQMEGQKRDMEVKLTKATQENGDKHVELQETKKELRDITNELKSEKQQSKSLKREVETVRNQLSAMARSMGNAAKATGNQTLMSRITMLSADPDEQLSTSSDTLRPTRPLDRHQQMQQSGTPVPQSSAFSLVQAQSRVSGVPSPSSHGNVSVSGPNNMGQTQTSATLSHQEYGGAVQYSAEASGGGQAELGIQDDQPNDADAPAGGMEDFFSVIELAGKQIKDLSAQVKKLEQRSRTVESKYECELETRQRTQAQLQESRTDRAKALRDGEKKGLKISSLEEEKRKLNEANKKYSKDLEKTEKKLEKTTGDRGRLKTEVETLRPLVAKVERLEKENHVLNKDIISANMDLSTATCRMETLEAELETAQLEKEQLCYQEEQHTAEIERLLDLTTDLEALKQERAALLAEIDRMTATQNSLAGKFKKTAKQFAMAKMILDGLQDGDKEGSRFVNGNTLQTILSEKSRHAGSIKFRTRSASVCEGSTLGLSAYRQPSLGSGDVGGRAGAESLMEDISLHQLLQTGLEGNETGTGTGQSTTQLWSASTTPRIKAPIGSASHAEMGSPSLPPLGTGTEKSPRTRFEQDAKQKGAVEGGVRPQSSKSTAGNEEGVMSGSNTPRTIGLGGKRSSSGEHVSAQTNTREKVKRFTTAEKNIPAQFPVVKEPSPRVEEEEIDPWNSNVVLATQTSIGKQERKWQKIQICILSWFARNLRRRLHEQTYRCAQVEIEKAEMEIEYLTQIKEQEKGLHELVSSWGTENAQVMNDAYVLVSEVSGTIDELRTDLDKLNSHTLLITAGLRRWNARFDGRKDMAVQSTDATISMWVDFVRKLPRDAPEKPLSNEALMETIVKIYHRRLVHVEQTGSADVSSENVFDAIKDHYTAQRKRGLLTESLTAPTGPIARLLMTCRAVYHRHPKVQMFSAFTGVSETEYLSPAAWQFFLNVLDCLRRLMGVNWKSTLKTWAKIEGTTVPLQCVLDLLGNLYNAEQPALLEVVSARLLCLMRESHVGPCIDLDALLMVLMSEFNLGRCPRNPLDCPRRCTDGSLPNLLNLATTQEKSPRTTAKSKAELVSRISSPNEVSRTPDIFRNFDLITASR